jgi:predicted ATPase/DNA-binding SARP family transcriptional activator
VTTSYGDLDVRLLGQIEVLLHGQRLEIRGKVQQRLLALLALEVGHIVSSDRIVDELWPDDRADGGAAAIKVPASRLRSALGAAASISRSGAGYRLEVPTQAVDVVRFERHIADAREQRTSRPQRAARAARAALELWRGEPFAGAGEPATGGALAAHAARLRELRLEALDLRIEADLALGAATELIGELESLLAEHPYRESSWRHLMLALYRADRQADALAAFHRARQALDDELGIEPGAELVALEAAILRHDIPPVVPPERRQTLPAVVTSFVGREAEVGDVLALLRRARLVTLTGVGGVGKTRLGLEAARAAAGDTADGGWFVDLARLADPDLVPAEVSAALNVPEDAGRGPVERLIDHLRERETLLLLDNCEHLLAACAALARTLLEQCPAVHILATSRAPLGIAGESLYPVPPMTVATDAVSLFLERARTASPGLALGATDGAVIERICEDLEGLPLPIELAAARARSLTLPDIADRLRDRFRFLVSWRRISESRHRTLREAMDWSYDLLEPGERQLIERLSVFAGGFDLAAAAAIAGDAGGTDAATLDGLERLMDASLVTSPSTRSASAGHRRYRLLETVRQHAAERLAAAGEDEPARERHARYYAALAVSADLSRVDGEEERLAIERLETDRDNIRVALAWLRDRGDWRELLLVVEALWRYWWVRGEAIEGRTWLERAVAMRDAYAAEVTAAEPAHDGTDRLLGDSLRGLAALTWSQGDFDAARAAAIRAEGLFAELDDSLGQGRSWNTIGVIEHAVHDVAAARRAFERSIALLRSADAEPVRRAQLLATSMDNLGSTYYETGETARAIELFTAAKTLHATEGQGAETALMDLHLGRAAAGAGNVTQAASLLAKATEHYGGLGFVQYTTECLEGVASLAIVRGDYVVAATSLGAASRMREQTVTPYWGRMEAEADAHAARARSALGDAKFEAAWSSGRTDPEQATASALAWVKAAIAR